MIGGELTECKEHLIDAPRILSAQVSVERTPACVKWSVCNTTPVCSAYTRPATQNPCNTHATPLQHPCNLAHEFKLAVVVTSRSRCRQQQPPLLSHRSCKCCAVLWYTTFDATASPSLCSGASAQQLVDDQVIHFLYEC